MCLLNRVEKDPDGTELNLGPKRIRSSIIFCITEGVVCAVMCVGNAQESVPERFQISLW